MGKAMEQNSSNDLYGGRQQEVVKALRQVLPGIVSCIMKKMFAHMSVMVWRPIASCQ
jgi:hypothetical protein